MDFSKGGSTSDGGADGGGEGVCGNGLLEPGEICDGTDLGGQTCETAMGHSDGELRCSERCLLVLSGCSTCGDGVVEGEESCDDGNEVAGDGCDTSCDPEPGWVCSGEPSVCNFTCGNGTMDPDEGCDDGNIQAGDGCSASCEVEPGWECGGEPAVCEALCGDGVVVGAEACDDGNTDAGDGCGSTCSVEPGWSCSGEPSQCEVVCGDGVVMGAEECDDGNPQGGDGCSPDCEVEPGWSCNGSPSGCDPICGDGLVVGGEGCDDGNGTWGDGCSPSCEVEPYFTCSGEPSACRCVVYVNQATVPGPRDGTSWANAYADVQSGVEVAESSEGCEVWVAQGSYYIYQYSAGDRIEIHDGVALYGGFDGSETARSDRDPQAHPTILDANHESSTSLAVRTIMDIDSNDPVTVDGFTFQNAQSSDNAGGGIDAKQTELYLHDCIFANNATKEGGGVQLDNVTGAVTGCTFSGNEAQEDDGGGLKIFNGSVELSGCTFQGNLSDGLGGGIHIDGGAHTLAGCTFTGNTAQGAAGGAIRVWEATAELHRCVFSQNVAPYGGGFSSGGSNVVLSNSVFSQNTASNYGGGGDFYYSSEVTIVNCVFYGNDADQGGAFQTNNSSMVHVFNTILWGNTPDMEYTYNGGDLLISYSALQDYYPGTGNIQTDPHFVAPNNMDFQLLSGSPCIDAADGDVAPSTDFEDSPRVDDPNTYNTGAGTPSYCDMGAFEYQP